MLANCICKNKIFHRPISKYFSNLHVGSHLKQSIKKSALFYLKRRFQFSKEAQRGTLTSRVGLVGSECPHSKSISRSDRPQGSPRRSHQIEEERGGGGGGGGLGLWPRAGCE